MDAENRRFERYAFPADRKICASLILPNGGGSVEARILNISEGGLGLAAERDNLENLEKDIELHLESLTGETGFACLLGKTLKVKWILDYEPLDNLGIGCEFINLDEAGQVEIKNLLMVPKL